ncbi:MAG: glycosyltransferase family 2 protein [Muribaculaceae bacterium]|nr:glycosyltransferase family 2 protein [Muribaculaceae bacterium]
MISVCLTTYNGALYLRDQICSILRQLNPEDELIISDDGSTDETLTIVEGLDDPRVRLLQNPGPHGVNGNFENALRHAEGDYIFLSDQDDVWKEGKISKCIQALETADLVVHDAEVVNSQLVLQNKTLFSELNIKGGFWNNFIRNRFTGCCMAFRKEILSYVLPFPNRVSFYHDNWIGLLVSLHGKVSFLNESLILFRRHGANQSSAAAKSGKRLSEQIGYRLSLGYNILKREIKR